MKWIVLIILFELILIPTVTADSTGFQVVVLPSGNGSVEYLTWKVEDNMNLTSFTPDKVIVINFIRAYPDEIANRNMSFYTARVIIQNSITLAEVVNTTMVEQGLYWEYTNDTSLSSGIYLMKARLENRSYSSVLTEYTLTVYPPPTPASDKGGFVGMASQSEAPVEEDTRVKEKTQVEEILIKEIIEEASPKHPLIAPIIQEYNERPQTYKLLFVGLIVVIRFFTLVRVWRDGTDEAA